MKPSSSFWTGDDGPSTTCPLTPTGAGDFGAVLFTSGATRVLDDAANLYWLDDATSVDGVKGSRATSDKSASKGFGQGQCTRRGFTDTAYTGYL